MAASRFAAAEPKLVIGSSWFILQQTGVPNQQFLGDRKRRDGIMVDQLLETGQMALHADPNERRPQRRSIRRCGRARDMSTARAADTVGELVVKCASMIAACAPMVFLEDNPVDAYFVRYALEAAHIANPVVHFETASQARAHFVEGPAVAMPALFVMDVHLAGGETGLDFLRWLRQQPPPLGSTPVMMLTGSDRPEDRDEAEALGAVHFLSKPVTGEALTRAVQSLGFVTMNLVGDTALRTIERR